MPRLWLKLLAVIVPTATLAGPADLGKIDQLPPYLVTANRADRWRYAAVPEFAEVLSCCSDYATRTFVEALYRQDRLLRLILPRKLQAISTVPRSLILLTPAMERTMAGQMLHDTEAVARQQPFQRGREQLPQLILHDDDSTGMVFALSDSEYRRLRLTVDYVADYLDNRVPALPLWFRVAISDLFSMTDWGTYGQVFLPPLTPPPSVKKRPDPTLPLGELFLRVPSVDPKDANEATFRDQWNSDLALFAYWAVTDSRRADAFWNFAGDCCSQAPTEDLFRSCFGLDFAAASDAIRRFRIAQSKSGAFRLGAGDSIAVPTVTLRDATFVEVARMEADFGIKELDDLRRRAPSYSEVYSSRIASTLADAEQELPSGRHDPLLDDVAGRFQFDEYHYAQSRSLLESAAAAHSARTDVYIDLAALGFHDALAHPKGPRGTLSADQVAAMMDRLRQNPRCVERLAALQLAANGLLRSAAPPSSSDVQFLVNAIAFYPKNPGLILVASRLCAKAGQKSLAADMASRGLALITAPQAKAQFQALIDVSRQ